jgi:hypothetical protein
MTKTGSTSRLAPVGAALALIALGVQGSARGSAGAAAAEPPAVQVLTTGMSPREGRAFLGVAIATLEDGARLSRSVTPTCTRGRVRVGSSRAVRVPVDVSRIPRSPREGGSIRSVTTCAWRLPRRVRGGLLTASVVVRYVNLDGTTAQTGQTVEWRVR